MRLRSFTVAVRPIGTWPGQLTSANRRSPSRFRSNWSSTTTLLNRELEELSARAVVLQLAVRPDQIRKDETGLLAHVRPDHPGVILSFTTSKGPLSYPCDTYIDWRDNVRAIALTLEHLRAITRYGASSNGQQYTGWSQLPAGRPMPTAMTREDAAAFIAKASGVDQHISGVHNALLAGRMVDQLYRKAATRLHPDVGGTTQDFQRLQEAKRVLDGD